MILDFEIPVGTRVEIDGHAYRYKYRLEFGHVLTNEATGVEQAPIPHAEMNGLYREGRVRLRGVGRLNRYTSFPDTPPGEELSPAERVRAFYVRAWDEEPCSISHAAMKLFIERVYAAAARKGLVGAPPSTGAVMSWIRLRGERDFRPDNTMRTRTGKVPRTGKFSSAVEMLVFHCICWYYAAEGRQKIEAHARLVRGLRLLNYTARSRYPDWTDWEAPCRETFRLRVEVGLAVGTYSKKFGFRRAWLYFHGTKPLTAPHVRHTVMIDSTTADHWCGYREASLVPLGRPTVYYAADVRSRLSIAQAWFGPPSLEGLTAILRKILTEWGHVETIIVDNALEHRGQSLKDALRGVGIDLIFSPVATPEHKAIVEKLIDGANRGIFRKSLGASVPFPVHLMRRFDLDPSETVSVTVESIQEWLDEYFGRLLPYRVHGGIGEAPALVWERETRQRKYRMVSDLQGLLARFGEMEVRTLTREGVTTKDGLRFYDPKAVTELLSDLSHLTPPRDRRKFSAKAEVKMVVDPLDISHCHVFNPKTGRWVRLDNVHIRFGVECRTRWEYRQVKLLVDKENAAFTTEKERLAALWRFRTLISKAAPAQVRKAQKRQLALMADSRLLKRVTQPPSPGYAFDAPDERPAAAASDELHPPAPAGKGPFDPTCGVEPIPIVLAEQVSAENDIPRKGVRRGGAKAVETQKKTLARKRAEAAAKLASDASPPTAPNEPADGAPASGGWGAFGAVTEDDLSADWIRGDGRKERDE